jgi:hypothetical protein
VKGLDADAHPAWLFITGLALSFVVNGSREAMHQFGQDAVLLLLILVVAVGRSHWSIRLKHESGQEIVRDENQQKRKNDRTGRRFADSAGTAGSLEADITADLGNNPAEYHGLEKALENVLIVDELDHLS